MALKTEQARHLLARTGFGPTAAELARFEKLDDREAVDRLLAGIRIEPLTAPPPGLGERPGEAGEARRREQGLALKAWWYAEMLATPSPLTERLTLFWHGHFTSSLQKVGHSAALYRQNLLFRREAAGNFGRLLHAVARDPAMLAYLDAAASRRDRPNENFARELLELFTLGEGHYTELDVKAAARAFTGWSVDPATGLFRARPADHDPGPKTFLGRSGRFDGAGIIDALLAQPRTAELIVAKLWREFVSPDPDAAEIRRLAGLFRDGGYEMKPLLRALFLSPAFADPAHRGTLVKGPVELLVGTVRLVGLPVDDAARLARAGRALGQDLFDPPDVRGWSGGVSWITAQTLLSRQQVLRHLVEASQVAAAPSMRPVEGRSLRNVAFALRLPAELRDADPARLRSLMLPLPPAVPIDEAGLEAGEIAAHLLLDPVYQLK